MSKLSSSKGKLELKYVSERHTISKLCTIKYAFKSCTLAELWTGMLLPGLVSISPLKSSFCEKKETKNVKTIILTNTPLIFLNLENRNILIVLHTKIPRLYDEKNIDIVVKMLQENVIMRKAISISLR